MQGTSDNVGLFKLPSDKRMAVILEEHNKARAAVGSPPLVWDEQLAAGAAAYAPHMTTRGLAHSPRDSRPKDVRENLLQSLRGGRSPRQMVDVWINEKRYFRPGIFPDVSTTGNWADIAHYTQIVWPTTTKIGCAIHSDSKFDWTICRYSPPGNRDGSPILASAGREPCVPTDVSGSCFERTTPRCRDQDCATPAPLPASGLAKPIHGATPPPEPARPRPAASEPVDEHGRHPLTYYFAWADDSAGKAIKNCDRDAAIAALRDMDYAAAEMRKRLAAAKQAGSNSSIRPEAVEADLKYIDEHIKRRDRDLWEQCPR